MRTEIEELSLRSVYAPEDVNVTALMMNDRAIGAYAVELELYCKDLLKRLQLLEYRIEQLEFKYAEASSAAAERR